MKSNLQQNVVDSILELLWFFDTSPLYSFFNAFKNTTWMILLLSLTKQGHSFCNLLRAYLLREVLCV